ncbi:hypothetical protein BC477_02480 [Clavibacter michiganensis subsp. michiganensis]|uniref:Recombinase family protein n=1 Tax=Clavibacter michiganensis subsp. michiganensis TaxID=33013 RepID=A0A251XJH7_CLAMM|nr:hypothetical protein BC477_02480 [Clavibacter michiganensis subsp. michiganensis]OUE03576.1 hypothetical protein CMMCAS07_01415 [Clavibacter michiganensis subsp. michiganensis]
MKVYSDNDISASDVAVKKKARPGYSSMLADARAGAFTHIIAHSNSRLTRRMLELEDLIKLFDQTGVVIQTVKSGQDDLSTSDGRMVARIKASVDIAESDRISERAKAAHRQKALKGEVKVQAKRPFGFQKDCVTHEPTEAALIREAVMKIIGGAPITQIQQEWKAAGIKTSTGLDEWRWLPLRRVLLGARTVGIREYKGEELFVDGEVVMGNWEPIITVAERDQALAVLQGRSKTKVRRGHWLLSGLLTCGKCGAPMYGSLGSPKKAPEGSEAGDYARPNTYSCNNANSHLAITSDRLEKYLQQVVFRYILDRTTYGTPQVVQPESDDWPQEQQLVDTSAKIDELMEAYNSGDLSGSIVFPEVKKLDQQRRDLRRDRDAFYASIAPVPTDVTNWWVATRSYMDMTREPLDVRRRLLAQEVESVVIGPGERGHGGKSFEAFMKRVTIQWHEPHPEYNGRSAEESAKELLVHMDLDKTFEPRPRQLQPSRGPKAMEQALRDRERRREDRDRRAQRRNESTS